MEIEVKEVTRVGRLEIEVKEVTRVGRLESEVIEVKGWAGWRLK